MIAPYTPGPWHAGCSESTRQSIYNADGVCIAQSQQIFDVITPAEAQANATLMAAAPLLLKELCLLNIGPDGGQRRSTGAWAAIAQAVGLESQS